MKKKASCIADRKYIKYNCDLDCRECEFLYEIEEECNGFSRLVKIVVYTIVVGIVLFMIF